jgi:hypothetical protein
VATQKKTRTSHIHLVHEGEKARLKIETEGFCGTCVRMCLDAGDGEKVSVAAGKKRIHVSGKHWKAHADKIEMCEDGKVVLTGHVKMIGDKVGVCTSIKAKQLTVKVKTGKCEKMIRTKASPYQGSSYHKP